MEEEKFICQYCNREFTTKHGLTYHLNRCLFNPDRIVNKPTYTIHNKVKCQYCSKEYDVANIKRHEEACSNPNSKLNLKKLQIKDYNKDFTCRYCGKQYKDAGNLILHETKVCKLNFNITDEMREARKLAYKDVYLNKSDESKLSMVWAKGLTKDINDSLRRASEKTSRNLKEHSEWYNGFTGYHEGSAKWCKYGWYNGFYCDSSWELSVVIYCLENNISIERNLLGFKYIYNNKEYTYYPDFIIDGIYTEVKGYWNDCEELKKLQFPYKLIILDKNGIKPYLLYIIDKYGKNFTEILYDKDKPNYLDNSGKINYKYFN